MKLICRFLNIFARIARSSLKSWFTARMSRLSAPGAAQQRRKRWCRLLLPMPLPGILHATAMAAPVVRKAIAAVDPAIDRPVSPERNFAKVSAMKRKSLLLILILTIILVFGCSEKIRTPADVTETVAWLDARSALPVFPFGTNPIYMFFNADWCKYCNAMKKEIFARPEIIDYMNHHITSISVIPESLMTVKFMGQEYTGAKLMDEFQVNSYPTHFFFNMAGELKGIRTGYIDLREFKLLLRYVAEGDIEKMTFDDFMASPKGEIDTAWGEF